jgi:hypothetical protein
MPVRHKSGDRIIDTAFRANLANVPYVSVVERVHVLADGEFVVPHKLGRVPDWWSTIHSKPGLEITESATVAPTETTIALVATVADVVAFPYPHTITLRVEKFTLWS